MNRMPLWLLVFTAISLVIFDLIFFIYFTANSSLILKGLLASSHILILVLLFFSRREKLIVKDSQMCVNILDCLPEIVAIHFKGDLQYVNQAALNFLEVEDPGEIIGTSIFRFIHPDSKDLVIERNEFLAMGKAVDPATIKLLSIHNTVSTFEVNAVKFQYYDRPCTLITARKKDTESEGSGQNRSEMLLTIVPDQIFTLSRAGVLIDIFSFKRASNELLSTSCKGQSIRDVLGFQLSARFEEVVKKVLDSQVIQSLEFEIEEGNSKVHYEARIINSNTDEVLVMVRNITDRKNSENRLKKSITEKETLIRELHHRVKNNLQIIQSLLSLQSTQITHKAAKQVLFDSIDRIRSMSMVHEMLFKGDDFSTVQFDRYCQKLIKSINNSYNPSMKVLVTTQLDETRLSLDTAIPTGIILNELLTNCFKHAFSPDSNSPTIEVLLQNQHGQVQLTVSDNGKGFKFKESIENSSSLGLLLVENLSEQLDGTLSVDQGNTPGSAISIEWHPEEISNG